MTGINKKLLILNILVLAGIAAAFFVLYLNIEELAFVRKKTENNAKEIESIKFDIREIRRRNTSDRQNDTSGSNNMASLKKKLSEMKDDMQRLKLDSNKEEFSEYKKREEKIWEVHAQVTKQQWSNQLMMQLQTQKFVEDEIDEVLQNYDVMLDDMKELLMKWYRDEIADEDISNYSTELVKQFHENNSAPLGDQKASIVLGIVFPDPFFRKSLFESEK